MARPIKPTALKVLKGTARPHRLNPREPKATPYDPLDCPDHLDETTRRWWLYLAEHVAYLRVTTRADIPAFEQIVGMLVDVEKLKKQGVSTVKTRKLILDALGKFGMTPSDRSKVSALEEPEESALDEFAAAAH